MNQNRLQVHFFTILLLGAIGLVFFILRPYISALFLAATLAIIFKPLHAWILRRVRGREIAAALATTALVFIAVLVPLTFLAFQVFQQAVALYNSLTLDILDGMVRGLQGRLDAIGFRVSLDVDQYLRAALNWVAQNIGSVFSSFMGLALGFFLVLLSFYYFLKDGLRLRGQIEKLSPLSDAFDERIFAGIERAINSVIKGSLLIALIQGVLTGIGFAIFGLPNALLWGSVAAFTALIPSIGTALVLIPAVAVLFLMGKTFAAAGLLIWGMVIVGLIDNILAPQLYERGIKIHPLLILLSVLGGINLFGLIGFILGPVILSLLFTLLEMYLQSSGPEKA